MLIRSLLVLGSVQALVFAPESIAQSTPLRGPSIPSRLTLEGGLAMSQPKGEFAANVGNGWGFNGTAMFRLDKRGYLQLRGDGGGAQYGNETKQIPLNLLSGRVSLEVQTSNMIGWGSIGPQIMIPDGPFRPYVNAAIAYTTFWTSSSLRGEGNSESVFQTTNKRDGSHAYVYGGGVNIPLGQRFTSGALNLGARYYGDGSASYLRKGDIRDNADGSVTLFPRRSRTDFVLWHLGVSFTLPASNRR